MSNFELIDVPATGYDYSRLEDKKELAGKLKHFDAAIARLRRNAYECLIELAGEVYQAHMLFIQQGEPKEFPHWCTGIGISKSRGFELSKIWGMLGEKGHTNMDFAAMSLIVSNGTPEDVRKKILRMSKSKRISAEMVREEIASYQATVRALPVGLSPAVAAAASKGKIEASDEELEKLAALPPDEQAAVIKDVSKGATLTEAVESVEETAQSALEKWNAEISAVASKIKSARKLPTGVWATESKVKQFLSHLSAATKTLNTMKGFAVCCVCEGNGSEKCKDCCKTGFMDQVTYESYE